MADPNKIPSLLDSPKLRLSAWDPKSKKRHSLRVSIWNNNPRFVCQLAGDELQGSERYITMPLDCLLFESLMKKLSSIAQGPSDYKFKAASLEPDKNVQQGQKAEIVSVADLWMGKDKEGCVYISVIDRKSDKAIVQFFFGASDSRFYKNFHSDGIEWSKAEMSVFIAEGFATLMARTVSSVIDRLYKPVEFQGNKSGGSGYSRNNGSSNSSGYQQRPSGGNGQQHQVDEALDTEIPF